MAEEKSFLKNLGSLLLRVGLSAALLVFLLRKMDVPKIWESVRGADILILLLAFIVFVGINFFLLLRWLVLMKGLSLKVSPGAVTKYFFIGLFFNLFLPTSTGGDIVKTIGVCRNTDQKAKVVASVIMDRLSGFLGIALIALLAFGFGYRLINDASFMKPILILATGALGLLCFLFYERAYRWLYRMLRAFPAVEEKLLQFHETIAEYQKRPVFLSAAVVMSIVLQVCLAFVCCLIARAMHQEIPLIYFLIFMPLVCVISSLPSIGGLGIRDAGMVYLLSKVGVSSEVALGISLINFIFMVAVGLMGGCVYVASFHSGRVQCHSSDPGVGPEKAPVRA